MPQHGAKRPAVRVRWELEEYTLAQSVDQLRQPLGKVPPGPDGLAQRVPGRAELRQQRPGRLVLVEALRAQVEIPAEAGIAPVQDRLKLQRAALTECKKLLHMIQLSKDRGYIDSGTFDYWTKLTVDVKCMTARWYDAERKTGIPVEPAGPIPEG